MEKYFIKVIKKLNKCKYNTTIFNVVKIWISTLIPIEILGINALLTLCKNKNYRVSDVNKLLDDFNILSVMVK